MTLDLHRQERACRHSLPLCIPPASLALQIEQISQTGSSNTKCHSQHVARSMVFLAQVTRLLHAL
jgi:hypothetical protein